MSKTSLKRTTHSHQRASFTMQYMTNDSFQSKYDTSLKLVPKPTGLQLSRNFPALFENVTDGDEGEGGLSLIPAPSFSGVTFREDSLECSRLSVEVLVTGGEISILVFSFLDGKLDESIFGNLQPSAG